MNRARGAWILCGWVFLVLSSGSTPAAAATVDRIVAVVNGEIITVSDLEGAVEEARIGLLGSAPAPDIPAPSELERGIFGRLIDKTIQLQLARKQGITAGAEEVQRALDDVKQKNGLASDGDLEAALRKEHYSLERYRAALRDQIMILKLINREVKSGVVLSDEEMTDYYRKHEKDFVPPPAFHLRQLFIPETGPEGTEAAFETARELATRIKNGADFQSMVERYSPGPFKKNGGDLGMVRKDHMLPEIQKAIERLGPGEISEPVRSPEGVHIFKLEGMDNPAPRPFEEVKAEIQGRIFQERTVQLYEKWLRDMRESAQVEIKMWPASGDSRQAPDEETTR